MSAKGREENLFLSTENHEGPRRKPFFVREGARRKPFFVHEGPRRTTKNTFFCPRRGAKGQGEHLFCPRRGAKGREENLFLSTKGRGGAGRTGQSHLSSDATIAREGHPQGVPLQTLCPGKGAHEGCPYRFREPHVGLSQFDAIALGWRFPRTRGDRSLRVSCSVFELGGRAENRRKRRIRGFRSGLGLVASEGCQALGAGWGRRLSEDAWAPASTGISGKSDCRGADSVWGLLGLDQRPIR